MNALTATKQQLQSMHHPQHTTTAITSSHRCKMDNEAQRNELIVKTTLELLQNVLPTNIMANLDQLDAGSTSDTNEFVNDSDEDRFIFEQLSKQRNQSKAESTSATTTTTTQAADGFQESQFNIEHEYIDSGEQTDNNASLTYYEIVEQEMMQSLPVTMDNIMVLSQILSDFPEISQSMMSAMNFQSTNQLTNLLVYALMSNNTNDRIEELMCLEPDTVNQVVEMMSEIIAQKKDAFIQWPNDDEILQNVRDFQCYRGNGEQSEFHNVFGALGTIEIQIKPALSKFYSISQPSSSSARNTHATYTPVKWQCSCDTNGFLQSSFVFVPTTENQSKNSYAFEVNPISVELEQRKHDELYMVADETLTIFPFLLTPHEKRMIDADSFNRALQSKRIVIDRTFEKIQRRFPFLKRIEHRDANSICNTIETIGILHNFFIIHRDDLYIDSD